MRAAFDVVLVSEAAAGLLPGVAGREDELSPPIREIVDALRGYRARARALPRGLRRSSCASRREADAWLERHGAALCPVAPDVAPPLRGASVPIDGEPIRPGGKLTLCTYANALGLPAVSVPGRCAATPGCRSASSSSAAAATSARCWRWRASSSRRSAAGWTPTRA